MPRQSPFDRLTAAEARTMLEELDRAVEYAGGWTELAARLSTHTGTNVSPQAVFAWATRGIPPERATDIEEALDGAVLRQRLRPDLYRNMRANN